MQAIKSMLHGGKTQSGTAAGSGAGIGAEGPICGQITVQVVQGGTEAMIGGAGPLAGQQSLTTAAGQAAHLQAPFAATTAAGGDPDAAAKRTSGFMVGGKPAASSGYGGGTAAGGMAGPGGANLTLDFSILSVNLDWSLFGRAHGFSGPTDHRFAPIVHIHTAGPGGALLNKTHAIKLGGAGGTASGTGTGSGTSSLGYGSGASVGGTQAGGMGAGYGTGTATGMGGTGAGYGTGGGIGAGGGGGGGFGAPLTFNARNLRVFAPPTAMICLYLCDDGLLRDKKLAIAGPLPATEWLSVSTVPLRVLGGAALTGTGTGTGTGAGVGTGVGSGVGTGVSTGMGTGSGYSAAAAPMPMAGAGYGTGGGMAPAPMPMPVASAPLQQPFIQQQAAPLPMQQPLIQQQPLQQQPVVVTQGVSQSASDVSGVSAPTSFGSVKPISGMAPSTTTGGIGTQPYGASK